MWAEAAEGAEEEAADEAEEAGEAEAAPQARRRCRSRPSYARRAGSPKPQSMIRIMLRPGRYIHMTHRLADGTNHSMVAHFSRRADEPLP